jgi:putative CRISPR-associated protein (TIGR02619 family)
MPNLILSTCGTSLLTNLAGDQRGLVIRHANARTPEEVPAADRAVLEGLILTAGERLGTADNATKERLSAELNGLLRYCGGQLGRTRDTHWLIATDTWLGTATAGAIAAVLEAAGQVVEVRRITDLRTGNLAEFRLAMAELARLCAQEVQGLSQGGWRVVFNLTGGFKSVQGFMQALGMLYADESVYVFEGTSELLRLPRLPISLDAAALVREHQQILRRLAAGLSVTAAEAGDLPEALTMEDGGCVTLSVWGDLVWAQAGPALLAERLWPPIDAKLRFGPGFEASVRGSSADELHHINERLADLARHLVNPAYNPARLNFKKLKRAYGDWTHECDAWAKAGAKRLFGRFEGSVFVVDALAEGLH